MAFQGGGRGTDPLLQSQLLPLQGSGRAIGFTDLLLEKIVLFLEVLQFGGGIVHRRLLLLICGNVALESVEGLNLFPQPGKFLLRFRKGAAETAVELGVQQKFHSVFLTTRHFQRPPSVSL